MGGFPPYRDIPTYLQSIWVGKKFFLSNCLLQNLYFGNFRGVQYVNDDFWLKDHHKAKPNFLNHFQDQAEREREFCDAKKLFCFCNLLFCIFLVLSKQIFVSLLAIVSFLLRQKSYLPILN